CLRYKFMQNEIMADFPTDWDVFPVNEFATFHQENRLEDPMGMVTLLKLGPDGKSTGIFKVVLFGGGIVDIPIPVTDIIHEPPPRLASMVIKISVRADKTNIALNCLEGSAHFVEREVSHGYEFERGHDLFRIPCQIP
ncbi:MAG: hypothetical protein ACK56I_22310, partial [bacterium]